MTAKSLLARVFSMHPLALTAALCLIPLTAAGVRWMWMAPGASERAARAAANELSVNVVKGVTEWGDRSLVPELQKLTTSAAGIPDLARGLGSEVQRNVVAAAAREIRHAVDSAMGENGQVAGLRGDFRNFTTNLTGQLSDLSGQLKPTIANINKASEELPPTIRDLRVTLARAGRTMGNVDGLTAKVNAAVPQFISIAAATGLKVQTTADESALTAQQTRLFMGNLAEATKPLPRWARIGLAVAPPLVQTGFTVGSWLALKGK